jgi:hypothetical protein
MSLPSPHTISSDAVVEFLSAHLPFESMNSGFALETYATENTGMGLRTKERIPKNAFVIEYGGDSITFEEAENREKSYSESQSGCFMYFCQQARIKVW